MTRQYDDDTLGVAQFKVAEIEPEKRARAVRRVAASAHNADDFRELLDMLGLEAAEGRMKVEVAP